MLQEKEVVVVVVVVIMEEFVCNTTSSNLFPSTSGKRIRKMSSRNKNKAGKKNAVTIKLLHIDQRICKIIIKHLIAGHYTIYYWHRGMINLL